MIVKKRSRRLESTTSIKSFSGSKNCGPIVTRTAKDLQIIDRHRQNLLSTLQSLDGLAPSEQYQKYYEIKPALRSVYKELWNHTT
tara:strand:+ start:248 stop:502 length:255 start_codon:yes stop_codon:yes gene_type:complete